MHIGDCKPTDAETEPAPLQQALFKSMGIKSVQVLNKEQVDQVISGHPTKILIVGSSKATREQAEDMIEKILSWYIPALDIVVNSNCKGIDMIANEIAKEKGFKVEIITPKTMGLVSTGRGNYFKNQEIANNATADAADIAYSIALPLGTTKQEKCSHCKKAALPYHHEKTAGCKTALRCENQTTVVLSNI